MVERHQDGEGQRQPAADAPSDRRGTLLERPPGWWQAKDPTPRRMSPVIAAEKSSTELKDLKRYLTAVTALVVGTLLLDLIGTSKEVPNLAAVSILIMLVVLVLCLLTVYRLRAIKEGIVRTVEPSVVDTVTGLPDEKYFWLRIKEEHKRMRRYGTPVSLALIDVNALASFNQTYGEPGGDAVLAHIARVLESVKRASDVATRLHDDEFALILLECDKEGAVAFAERLEHYVTREPAALTVNGQEVTLWVGMCIGVAGSMEGETSSEELVARARRSLEADKEERNKRRERWTGAWL
jgi:diguanylate cyclase (GGDEF)-like protein